MHLITLPVSPFAARVRAAIYAKKLEIGLAPPPAGWPRNPLFLRISPTGRIPVLVLDDDEVILESTVILEFLEEHFPEARPLLPGDAFGRAKVRFLIRVVDLYLMLPMVALAKPQLEQRLVPRFVGELLDALVVLDDLLGEGPYAYGDCLSLADCALGPALFAARVTSQRLGLDLIESAPRVGRYAAALGGDEHMARVIGEMEEGLRQIVRSQ